MLTIGGNNMSETTRIDPTAMGLLFIGFILFVVGIFGIDMSNKIDTMYIGGGVFAVALFGAFALTFVAVYAYKAGSSFGATVFGWVAVSMFLLAALGGIFDNTFSIDLSEAWFLWIIVGIFYLIFTAWSLLAKAPKLLAGVLFFVALVFMIFGLALYSGTTADNSETYFLIGGICSLIGFILSTYLGFALTGATKMPVA